MLTPDEKMKIIKNSLESGYRGSINKMIEETEQKALKVDEVARTPEEQEQGLRGKPAGTSMAFTDSTGNFNTKGMSGPINIKKMDKKGNVVRSYDNVPPGIENLPMGDDVGTVIETPGTYQDGGVKNDLLEQKPGNKHSGEFKKFLKETEGRMMKQEQEFNANRELRGIQSQVQKDSQSKRYQEGGSKQQEDPDSSEPPKVMVYDSKNLEAWPTLFQNSQTGKWFELFGDMAKKEARSRGLIYKFDSEKQVYDFAVLENWKSNPELKELQILNDTYLKNLNFMHEAAPKNKKKTSYVSKNGWGGAKKYQNGGDGEKEVISESGHVLKRAFVKGTKTDKEKDQEYQEYQKKMNGNTLENFIYISDKRKIRGMDGGDIVATRDLKGGKYNKDLLMAIIARAKYYNLDPRIAIAIAMQETNIGKTDNNLGHVLSSSSKLDALEKKGMGLIPEKHNNAFRFSYIPYMASLWNRHNPNSGIEGAADVNDGEAYTFQRYNGVGNIYNDTEAGYHATDENPTGISQSFYGVPIPRDVLYTKNDTLPDGKKVGDVKTRGFIDMKKDKLYGKQIIDFRDNIINNNQDLLDLIKSTPAYTVPVDLNIQDRSQF